MSSKTLALDEKIEHLDLAPSLVVDEAIPLSEVLGRMRQAKRGSVMVCRDGKLTGVFTERDYLNKYALENVSPDKQIGEFMTPHPEIIHLDTPLGKAVELMHEKHVRNLPIVDAEGRPKGLLTVGRVIRYLADHYPREVVNLPPKLRQIMSESEGA